MVSQLLLELPDGQVALRSWHVVDNMENSISPIDPAHYPIPWGPCKIDSHLLLPRLNLSIFR